MAYAYKSNNTADGYELLVKANQRLKGNEGMPRLQSILPSKIIIKNQSRFTFVA
jgi:hypothetical protein